jgi:hypothetical protein
MPAAVVAGSVAGTKGLTDAENANGQSAKAERILARAGFRLDDHRLACRVVEGCLGNAARAQRRQEGQGARAFEGRALDARTLRGHHQRPD